MLNIAICDDVRAICHFIENALIQYTQANKIRAEIEVFYDGTDLYDFICREHGFDLIYLDIEMPSLSGIELSRNIRSVLCDSDTEIVFVSGTTQLEETPSEFPTIRFSTSRAAIAKSLSSQKRTSLPTTASCRKSFPPCPFNFVGFTNPTSSTCAGSWSFTQLPSRCQTVRFCPSERLISKVSKSTKKGNYSRRKMYDISLSACICSDRRISDLSNLSVLPSAVSRYEAEQKVRTLYLCFVLVRLHPSAPPSRQLLRRLGP